MSQIVVMDSRTIQSFCPDAKSCILPLVIVKKTFRRMPEIIASDC